MKNQTFWFFDPSAIEKAATQPYAQQPVPDWDTYSVFVVESDQPGYQLVTIQPIRANSPGTLERNKLVKGTDVDALKWAETHLQDVHIGKSMKKSAAKDL